MGSLSEKANGFPVGSSQTGKPRYFYNLAAAESSAGSAVAVDEVDCVLDGRNLFSRIVGNFDIEFFFKGHDQLDNVEAVGTKIVDEAGFFGHFVGFDAQMFYNNLFNPVRCVAHYMPLL
jgi:hypothetical protein